MYKVHIGYAGINYYVVYDQEGDELYYGFSEDEIVERLGVSVDEMERV